MKSTRTTVRRRSWMGVLLATTLSSTLVSSFGLASRVRTTLRQMSLENLVPEIAEAVNTETYLESIVDGGAISFNETELLVSTGSANAEQQPQHPQISPNAPFVTYEKFLTMQNKRVPVAVRYSGESGLKPYFLTVAKKIKESHPDVVLDKVILPKVDLGEGDKNDNPTFEVLVDGKVVVRTTSRKDRSMASNDGNVCVFVSMEELDIAISRARRRRRPTTVYGEDANARLELAKNRSSVKHSKD